MWDLGMMAESVGYAVVALLLFFPYGESYIKNKNLVAEIEPPLSLNERCLPAVAIVCFIIKVNPRLY